MRYQAQNKALDRSAGSEARHLSAANLPERYFADRMQGRRPSNNTEDLLVAIT